MSRGRGSWSGTRYCPRPSNTGLALKNPVGQADSSIAMRRKLERPLTRTFALRPNRYSGSLLLFAGLMFAMSACSILPDAEFAALEGSLTLAIVEVKRTATDDSADFSFTLKNGGSDSARACLGEERAVSYKTSQGGGITSRIAEPPGCTREFTIQPGGVMSWNETLEVPRLSEGSVEIEFVRIQIVNPRRCRGCGSFDLRSNPFEIP